MASCLIIHPITFELDVIRNMNGAKKKEDPAEIRATGTLYEIRAEMSKNDYDVLMAILINNFSEKGSFESSKKPPPADSAALNALTTSRKSEMSLPLKKRYSSQSSMGSQHSAQLQEALKMPERDPEARGVEFEFTFRGFKADLHSGDTPLDKLDELRKAKTALARIQVRNK